MDLFPTGLERPEVKVPEAAILVIVVHDSATCAQPPSSLFEGLPIVEGRLLKVRQPYVAVMTSEASPTLITELTGDRLSALGVTVLGDRPNDGDVAVSH